MDWTTVAAKVVSLGAPMLGSALGGPLGGMAGKVLADAFGAAAATPDAVHAAISDKAADLKLAAEAAQKAESEWMSALAEIGKAQVGEVGETMRAEAVSEDVLQRWWRPLYALELSLIECPAFSVTLLHALWTGHDAGYHDDDENGREGPGSALPGTGAPQNSSHRVAGQARRRS